MIDLPLSVVAWISVVVVQAVIHYIVLGVRSQRGDDESIAQEIETDGDVVSESIIASDDHPNPATRGSPYADIVSQVDSIDEGDEDDDEPDYCGPDDATTSTAGMSNDRSPRPSVDFDVADAPDAVLRRSLYTVIRNEDLLDGDEPPDYLDIVTQTGSELLKSKSVECLVLEQLQMSQ